MGSSLDGVFSFDAPSSSHAAPVTLLIVSYQQRDCTELTYFRRRLGDCLWSLIWGRGPYCIRNGTVGGMSKGIVDIGNIGHICTRAESSVYQLEFSVVTVGAVAII